jgi:FtsP/CotA-like multicopper oxidase with cupredoxin domain
MTDTSTDHVRTRQSDALEAPTITASVAAIFAVFGLAASLVMGWVLARSMAGLPPFGFSGRAAALPDQGAGAQSLAIVASDLKFDTRELRVAGPGEVKVRLENRGLIEHDFSLEGVRGKVYARPGATAEGAFKLDRPGTYTFYCSIPGHREAGMSGTLVVGSASGNATGGTGSATPAAAAQATSSHAQRSHAAVVSTQTKGNQPLPFTTQGAYKVFELTARPVQWEVLPGVREEAWTYNDQLPGPVIRVTEGDQVRVVLKNELPEPTVLHFHGPRLPNAQDGVPDVTQPVVPVGGTYTYEFTATPAGTYVYHTHHNTATQEPKGLYGVLIIDPKPGSAEAAREAQYARDYLQVISEFSGYFTINGKAFPATEVLEARLGEKVRLRLVNLGQTAHPMHLHGYHFRIVGADGVPVEGPPLVKDTINIAPGERYDLEFVADNPGTWVFHCHILSHVASQGVEPGGMITVLKVS